jgi:hypothetical protein
MEMGLGIHIMIYPMFILLLPFDLRPIFVMILAFFMGLAVDWLTNSFGLHAASAVFLGYARPQLFNVLAPREGYDPIKSPTLRDMGIKWFLIIYLVGLLIHHFFFFVFEVFKFSDFFFIIGKTILSALVSFLIIWLVQIIFFTKKRLT